MFLQKMCFFYRSAFIPIFHSSACLVSSRQNKYSIFTIAWLLLRLFCRCIFSNYKFIYLFVFHKLYPPFLSVMLTPDRANILGKKSDESVYYSLSADLNKRGFGNSNICEMERFGLLGWGGQDRLYYLQTNLVSSNVLSRANVLSPQSEVIDVSLLLLQKMIMFVCYHGFVRLRKIPIFSVLKHEN